MINLIMGTPRMVPLILGNSCIVGLGFGGSGVGFQASGLGLGFLVCCLEMTVILAGSVRMVLALSGLFFSRCSWTVSIEAPCLPCSKLRGMRGPRSLGYGNLHAGRIGIELQIEARSVEIFRSPSPGLECTMFDNGLNPTPLKAKHRIPEP